MESIRMKKPVVIIGMGEMGGVFARGFLKLGLPVYPVTKDMVMSKAEKDIPSPETVIVAVGEKALPAVLQTVPQSWKNKLVLLQNELLPKDWQSYKIDPTVISVWFEKKQPNDYKVLIPSVAFGPQAQLVAGALAAIQIPCKVLKTKDELLFELVVKNLYILTVNIAGLEAGGTVSELWDNHRGLAQAVADDVLDIQFSLIGKELDRKKLVDAMLEAFKGDPRHKCMGRSAPVRLERAIGQADKAGLKVEKLRDIYANQAANPQK